jgi:ketosteroid isomerase-like protein
MSEHETVHRFYQALQGRDLATLSTVPDPGFAGQMTQGLPLRLGGLVTGRDAMLGVWGKAAKHYQMQPQPQEYLDTGDGRIVVLGWYVGRGRTTGKPIRARFVHVLRVRDGKLIQLEQVTDTKLWADALESSEADRT